MQGAREGAAKVSVNEVVERGGNNRHNMIIASVMASNDYMALCEVVSHTNSASTLPAMAQASRPSAACLFGEFFTANSAHNTCLLRC
jgi:hypothetical protein